MSMTLRLVNQRDGSAVDESQPKESAFTFLKDIFGKPLLFECIQI